MIWKRLHKYDPEKEEKLQNEIEEHGGLEKNDMLAMIIAALIVILPVAIIVLVILALLGNLPFLFS